MLGVSQEHKWEEPRLAPLNSEGDVSMLQKTGCNCKVAHMARARTINGRFVKLVCVPSSEQLWMILHFCYAKRERNSFWKSPTCVVAELLLFLFAENLKQRRKISIFRGKQQRTALGIGPTLQNEPVRIMRRHLAVNPSTSLVGWTAVASRAAYVSRRMPHRHSWHCLKVGPPSISAVHPFSPEMADGTKHLPLGGGALFSDFTSLFSMARTRRTMFFVYGFMFAFIVFTVFLAFSPANASSPWFTNIFATGTGSGSSSTSDDSYRSQFSSFFSFWFPNSSQEQVHNFTSVPTPTTGTNATRSNDAATFQSPQKSKDPSGAKNETKVEALTPNRTAIAPPKPLVSANQSAISSVKSPPSEKGGSGKDDKGVASNSTVKSPSTEKSGSETKDKGVAEKRVASNSTVKSPPTEKNGSESKDKGVAEKRVASNSTVKSPPTEKNGSETKDKGVAEKSVASNSTVKSPPTEKSGSGKEDKGVAEKGVVSNYTASLLKKQSNGTDSKQRTGDWLESLMNCNLFEGQWVKDDSYPLYKPGSCSLIDEQFNCFRNGRPDKDYMKLKWKPKGCDLPRLNGSHMLELLRGKRLVFVGDSLNRNMWESLVCILRNSVKDRTKVYEASGRHHFRTEASYSFIFEEYHCSVEFFVSPFLVQEWEMPDKNGSTKETLRLDKIPTSSDKYKTADIIIFNTGHWWTHDKTSKGKDYYQEGSHVYGELNVMEAFRKALTTWARWVDANVNPAKSLVFFRGYSSSHFSGGQWNSGGQCDGETKPIRNETYIPDYPPKMIVMEKILRGMKTQVTYLNITRITDYRKDGHPSIYRKQNLSDEERRSPLRFQDCSHWCLPGVPDAWNELLYAEILIRHKQNEQKQHQQQQKLQQLQKRP